MRDYRIELQCGSVKLTIYVKAATEYDAMQKARKDNPGFTVSDIVEVMPSV